MWERAGRREKDDPPAMVEAHKNFIRGKLLANAYLEHGNLKDAAHDLGMTVPAAAKLLEIPAFAAEVEEGLSNAARAAGISKTWLLKKLVVVVDRCLQDIQVYDKDGNATGEYKFDSRGATKALELIGKHLRAFGEDDTTAATKVGQAVIRLLAQEAQAGRLAQAAGIIESGPIPEGPDQGTPLASTQACDPPAETHTQSVPNPAPNGVSDATPPV